MRIGLLSDAHGNHLGLSLCLRALKTLDVETVFFLGDAGGYFSGECEVLRILEANSIACQLGNHDAMIVGRFPISPEGEKVYRLTEAKARITPPMLAFLSSWPEQRVENLGGRKLLMLHGSPAEPLKGYVYPDSDCSAFENLPYDAVFLGNTHYPFVKSAGSTLIVNAGSCGLPRDQGDAPSFAVYDCVANRAEIYRVRLDPRAILKEFLGRPPAEEVRQCLFRNASRPIVGRFLEIQA